MGDGHGGNLAKLAKQGGRKPEEILDFSASINPLGLPDWLRPAIGSQISSLRHYPDPECTELVAAIARRHQVSPEEVLVGNGSTEILYALPRALPVARVVAPVPSYADYTRAAELAGLPVETAPLREERGFLLDLAALEASLRGDEAVFLGQPNNPTGLALDPEELRALAARQTSTWFILDEAFAAFVEGLSSLAGERPANVVVVRSLTKLYAIPGLRLGYALADRELAARVREFLLPWSVNSLAQAVGVAALQDEEYAAQTRAYVRLQRARLAAELSGMPGLYVYPGTANFLLVRMNRADMEAPRLAARLLEDGIAIRVCENFAGLDARFFRVAVRTEEENARLVEALRRRLGGAAAPTRPRRTPAIMLQGTSSNAGKSVLTAALCRIFLQDGYAVAPFKSQNMSLNSFVTREGGEMGRAQVVQAQACRIEPDVRMNPILLKPNSDTGSQIIVSGQPVGNMSVQEYLRFKPEAFRAAREAYDSLAAEHAVMVLEGAGSPAEVNLKRHDIVNMTMARHARAPVLLVGDIDRGGVYASFVGTLEVLAEWERAQVAGFVVNRFRGRVELLADAHDYVLGHTGRPVLGVVPYLHDLGLPEEDSVSFKAGLFATRDPDGECLEVAVIDLPHISNFTDFDALRLEPDVRVRVVRTCAELGSPDVVILPGSKNVIGDLAYLRETALDRAIDRLARDGRAEIVGICGGLQMLGREIADPYGLESAGKSLRGLGLLPVTTVLAREKTLARVEGKHVASGLALSGYEIHHGRTELGPAKPATVRADGEVIGVGAEDGRIWGTYLHGCFDTDPFRHWYLDRLRLRRGWPALTETRARYDLEPAFARLAAVVRDSLDMSAIYRLMGLR